MEKNMMSGCYKSSAPYLLNQQFKIQSCCANTLNCLKHLIKLITFFNLIINMSLVNGIPSTNQYPRIGKPAPVFKGTAVVNGSFKEISLNDYKGKYVILFFYPLDFTFVCPTEIVAFSDRVAEFRSIGCEVIACSTDSHFTHLAWINTPRKQGGLGEMNIPLLADKNLSNSLNYGVYREDDGITFRGLFIIDDKGVLRQITINDLPVGRSVDETLRLVKAFQYTDKHGEVCPANWKPGDKTIVPDVASSKEYFSKAN
ncbi:peroxiredoxin 1-like [Panonychus citri]|uniref:peroxiredoxin 1-like n=1 Tax=Panonychus citri TaxID=50023 RepID=UPI002307E3DC|nr:peroxiredoxin 1-like [Panonychus citri]